MSLREVAALSYNTEKELQSVVYDTPWDAKYETCTNFMPCYIAYLIIPYNCANHHPVWFEDVRASEKYRSIISTVTIFALADTIGARNTPIHIMCQNSTGRRHDLIFYYDCTIHSFSCCRGPFAHAATSWTGFDCQNAICPSGIDPQSRNAVEGAYVI